MIPLTNISARHGVVDIVPRECTGIVLDFTETGRAVTATVLFGDDKPAWKARAENPSFAVGVAVVAWQRAPA